MALEPNLRNRAWLLGLLWHAKQAGVSPIEKGQVHALVFLANGLAPIYEDAGVDARVIKHPRGPFYPDAQWDLDRMVGQGLLHISQVRLTEDDVHQRWWFDARYAVTHRGAALFAECRKVPLLERSYRFLVELTAAFASLTQDARERAPLQDVIYSTPNRGERAALVFENLDDNYAALTADAFAEIAGPNLRLHPRERVHLYLAFLAETASAHRRDGPEAAP